MSKRILPAFIATAMVLPVLALQAAPAIPLDLPHYDGKPGDPTKPVKVYILAGQSNMVGFGHLSESRPLYPSVFLSADPAIIPGGMPVGSSAVAAHGVFQSADADAATGAQVALHEGAYDPQADYAKLTPAKTASVALGTVAATLPSLDGPHTPVVSAFIEVPKSGTYTLNAGFGDSSHAIITLAGKEVYRKLPGGRPELEKSELEAGRRYPINITYFQTGSAAFWMEQVDLVGTGDLMSYIKNDGKYTYLLDPDGAWVARNDVYFQEARLVEGGRGSLLSATSNGSTFGPELGFGFVMGTFHDEQVLLIKTAQGNRSLGFDFRPPSSGREDPDSDYESAEYRLMIKGVRETLANIDKVVPGYQGQGYEIAGFAWWQGHKDAGATQEEYEKHLVNLINDVRKEFDAPEMRAVVATVGFDGFRINENYQKIWAAQMAVGDPAQHPDFAGTVASVDTRDFWRDIDEAPQPQGHHYNRSAETFLLTGEAMGREMVKLLGGTAEPIPVSDREARTAARLAAEAAKPTPSAGETAAALAAMRPMVLDGALRGFVSDPRQRPALEAAMQGKPPARPQSILDDVLDTAADYFRAVGINEYDWKPFGGGPTDGEWHYHPFDLDAPSQGVASLEALAPAGMENWFTPEFDANAAGWKTGGAPFGGNRNDPSAPPTPSWYGGAARAEAKTAFDHDGVLLRRTFKLPPLKDGHRYRVRIAGSVRANSGDGYAIFANGKLLAESKAGIVAWRREGGRPRGGHVTTDFRDEFQGGEVTLAIANFPMNNRPDDRFIPAGAPLGVWLEEMKLPPLDLPNP